MTNSLTVEVRRKTLDGLQAPNQRTLEQIGDPETRTRIAQYEMAFRMQSSVPELTNSRGEPESTLDRYGDDVKKPGSFANTASSPGGWSSGACGSCRSITTTGTPRQRRRPAAEPVQGHRPGLRGLIQDLKARGLLDDTLVIWGGEFGRTVYSQGGLSKENYGRDHHPRCFTMWMAGGGVKPRQVYGETDDFSYNIVKDPVHIHDLHATVLHLLGSTTSG